MKRQGQARGCVLACPWKRALGVERIKDFNEKAIPDSSL